uniref:Aa_trans domain-containing protein n=1 Tax=Hydatigena taeniaeformis TaxID=6205 RepID=A0A0R3X3B2_HYDTA
LLPHIFNLINSNIGVGLLAMPFCFHECGIVLMIITLLLMTIATYYSCLLIINSTTYFRCDSLERAGLYYLIPDNELFSIQVSRHHRETIG